MKIAFIVQGEGRGHQTQAIALKNILEANGHQVGLCLMSSGPEKTTNLLTEVFPDLVIYQAPNLIYKQHTMYLQIGKTVLNGIKNFRQYIKSLETIEIRIIAYQPDIVINFYDFLGGVYYMLKKRTTPVYCIGHQFLFLHPDFKVPSKHSFDHFLVKLLTSFIGLRAKRKVALSFRPYPFRKGFAVVPPLIRQSILALKPITKPFILVYLTQLDRKIISTFEKYPEINFHCFLPKHISNVPSNIKQFKISQSDFINQLSECSAIISTSGFETIAEAAYLKKPVYAIPLENHFEQLSNYRDALDAGIGFSGPLEHFIEALTKYKNQNFWHNQNDIIWALDL